jgi:transposase
MMKNIFEQALAINKPWYVKSIDFDVDKKQLDIYIDFKKGFKFNYKDSEKGIDENFPVHDTKEKTWRHLNFFQHECYLHCRTPRIKLTDGSTRLISPPWSGINSGFTMLFEALLIELCKNMPVKSVAKMINETDKKIWRILEKYIDSILEQEDYSDIDQIGIDETSRAKNHEYITLFVDLIKKRTIYIADGKSSKTVTEFNENLELHGGSKEQISDVSCDMSPAFIKGVKETFPNAEITFDKFHIIKLINEAVDQVRREEVKIHEILKNKRYIFLKNENNLTKKQKIQLNEISIAKLNLKTVRALHIKRNFQAIYHAETENEFVLLLQKWYWWATHSRIEPIRKVAHTIKAHWDGVVNWKKSQINNGLLEGLNSLIQAAKSKARGYRNTKYFKIIAYLITGKFDFSKINPECGNI